MSPLHLPAPAKLNLFLHILGRREDGYHELQTLFQLLDFGDRLTIAARPDGAITLDCPGLAPGQNLASEQTLAPEQNLAWRAAWALREHSGATGGASITIDKRIPVGGGLGGGSSDAATVLLALNRLWGLHLPLAELAELGLRLGADVPVFVGGRSAWGEGVGERLTPLAELPQPATPEQAPRTAKHQPAAPPNPLSSHYLILVPDCQIATGEIFAHRDLTRDGYPITIAAFHEGAGRNDCESIVRRLHPEVNEALNWLDAQIDGASQARLSGTGACVFAAFPTRAAAEAALAQAAGWQEQGRQQGRGNRRAFIAAGIDSSPVHRLLQYPGY